MGEQKVKRTKTESAKKLIARLEQKQKVEEKEKSDERKKLEAESKHKEKIRESETKKIAENAEKKKEEIAKVAAKSKELEIARANAIKEKAAKTAEEKLKNLAGLTKNRNTGKGIRGSPKEPVDCVVLWNPFSECSVSCGGGEQKRSVKSIVRQPQHGGKACPKEE